jgi:hypothetical protein
MKRVLCLLGAFAVYEIFYYGMAATCVYRLDHACTYFLSLPQFPFLP